MSGAGLTALVKVRLEETTKAVLEQFAREDGRPTSQLARVAIVQYLERRKAMEEAQTRVV